MSPNFLPNAFVVVIRYPWQRLKLGEVVLVNHPHYGTMIKRIESITANSKIKNNTTIKNAIKITLKGDNLQSVTTEQMGEINHTQVIGKVIWQIKPPHSH